MNNTATKAMWLNRWNNLGSNTYNLFQKIYSNKIALPILAILFLPITLIYFYILLCICMYKEFPPGLILVFFVTGFCFVFINFIYSVNVPASNKLIASSMQMNWCVKDYVPKIINHKVAAKQVLTISDVEKAISECESSIKNTEIAKQQAYAAGIK